MIVTGLAWLLLLLVVELIIRRTPAETGGACGWSGAGEEIGELLLPWPGVELLAAVRRDFPRLSDELVYSVAQARARLGRRAPGPLG